MANGGNVVTAISWSGVGGLLLPLGTDGVIAIVDQQFTHCEEGITLVWAATTFRPQG
jgi:hypothetical protein